MASQREKAFSVPRFEVSRSVITDLDTSKRGTLKAFSRCDAILETGPALSMRSELLVANEKLGQLLLLAVYVVPV